MFRMADSMSVSVLDRAMVLPAHPRSHTSFFLSCLDIMWQALPYYNQRLIFYQTTLSEDGQQGSHGRRAAAVMEKLKSSLALCLVHYYPWCGRLTKGAESPHRLFIDCSDAGVEFVEASSPLPLSLLAGDGFQMKPLFQQLCQQPLHQGDCLFSSPLLSIQATLFSDGGLVLGIAHSHVVADGQSLWDFMVSWGECARGVPLSLPPLHNREMLAVLDPSPDKATWNLTPEINEEDKEEEERYSMENKDSSAGTISVETNPSSGADKTEPLVPCMFNLPASAIKKLKSESGGVHTSFEVICAHFWKHFVTARENAMGESTYFFAPVNCRTRMTPPLPPSYFGNVIPANVTFTTVGAIQRETLRATACRVHDAVARIKEDYILGFMHWLETHDFNPLDAVSSVISTKKGLNTASSPWFPAYQVDYGWGKPVAVRPATVRGDGELVLFGGRPGSMPGDVEICTALPESVLKRLLDDPAFLARPPCCPLANE